jgi:hypothetical protein
MKQYGPCCPKFAFIVTGIDYTHTAFHAIGYQGIAMVVTEHNVGNASGRLDPSSVLAVFKALYK